MVRDSREPDSGEAPQRVVFFTAFFAGGLVVFLGGAGFAGAFFTGVFGGLGFAVGGVEVVLPPLSVIVPLARSTVTESACAFEPICGAVLNETLRVLPSVVIVK